MGLDMFLHKEVYVGANYEHNGIKANISITNKKGEKIKVNPEKIIYIVEDFAYWRKANHIHKWFVDNIQGGKDDCGDYRLAGCRLLELVDKCKIVREHPDKASELLPRQEGFFFGSNEYDEDYFNEIHNTIKQLENINPDDVYIYHASW